jgi:uncharacterized tellurite resistance protein B-like protein
MEQQNPFLALPEDVKTSYLVIMASIATADHQNSEAEIAFMEQMSKVAGLSDDSRQKVTNAMQNPDAAAVASHLEKFKNNNIKFALVSDLINLAYADGNFNSNEESAIQATATQLNISKEQYDALVQYIQTANKEAAKREGAPAPAQKAGEPSFLEKFGLKSVFEKLGIPVEHFLVGTTITAALGTVAYMLLQNYTRPNAQGNHTGTLGDMIGNWIGGVIGGTPKEGQPASAGMQGMIANFFTSDAGAATINNIINNVAKATSEGKGIGNLMDIVGGGQNGQNNLIQGMLGAFLSGSKK